MSILRTILDIALTITGVCLSLLFIVIGSYMIMYRGISEMALLWIIMGMVIIK